MIKQDWVKWKGKRILKLKRGENSSFSNGAPTELFGSEVALATLESVRCSPAFLVQQLPPQAARWDRESYCLYQRLCCLTKIRQQLAAFITTLIPYDPYVLLRNINAKSTPRCNLEAPLSMSIWGRYSGSALDNSNFGGPQLAEGDVDLSEAGRSRALPRKWVCWGQLVCGLCSYRLHHVSVCPQPSPILRPTARPNSLPLSSSGRRFPLRSRWRPTRGCRTKCE